MSHDLAQRLMDDFAVNTGLVGVRKPRRYLWTDAFAVCNYLGLFERTGEDRYLALARTLVDQVHDVLGHHRHDDPRRGWISGLSADEGRRHPTRGGLRIGKTFNERGPDEPPDSNLEWDRDGQYFHYLTKWIHALFRMGRVTTENRYFQWADDLATVAHQSFTRQTYPGGPKRIMWKMSIDLTRPQLSSTGRHDPVDGLIAFLEVQNATGFGIERSTELAAAVAEMSDMCEAVSLPTDDPLGIGGLLDDATRLSQLICEHGVERRKLLYDLLVAAEFSLREFERSTLLHRPAEHRLAFRELGLSIGINGLHWVRHLASEDRSFVSIGDQLSRFSSMAEQIQSYWSNTENQRGHTWTEHSDINIVMLSTSLAPSGYLQL